MTWLPIATRCVTSLTMAGLQGRERRRPTELVTMRRAAVFLGSLPLLLALPGCADSGPAESDDDVAACKKLLGAAGVDWVKRNSESETGVMPGFEDLNSAKGLFEKQAISWDSRSADIPSYVGSELCRIVERAGTADRSLTIRYGASILPFGHTFGDDWVVKDLNVDVKLVYGKEAAGRTRYTVHIRCQVKGAAAGQKDEVPLEGVMVDTLTNADSVDEHSMYLLHSARTVLKTFECLNDPQVPTDLADGAGGGERTSR
ncbi:hypothetical protein AB0G19_23575 [Streptomyces althioticus]|uniref:hypothetical protein n=1 Tax=Streptomyces althioticus group TaxID=2867194 RepID=UPI0033F49860|nr:hypothetical protein OHA53_13105 [Streptomyces althioticus]